MSGPWGVFGFYEDGSWWRVFDTSCGEEIAKSTAEDMSLENRKDGKRYEAHPFDWIGDGPVAIAGVRPVCERDTVPELPES